MVAHMELDELLDREGLDGDELMTWAKARTEQLLAELVGASDELVHLLEPAAQIDLEAIPVRRVEVLDDMLPVSVGDAPVEDEVEESITSPISLPPVHDEPSEPDAAEVGARGRRRVPSTPQPLSASELPPPPEQPRLADGEPEPILETFDTGPIDLGTAEAREMIAATSTRAPMIVEPEVAASDGTEEFEIDELEELDDEELELLEEAADDDEDSDAAPAPPPRPPAKPGAPRPPVTVEEPSDTGDSFDIDVD
jgi:hypothetical protein